MIYLTLPELLHVARRVLGSEVAVRDYGMLEAALARPQATVFGKDAYPSLDAKAAALLHSLARNHALIDGNKRLALAAVIAFYGLNGRRLTFTNDQAYDLAMKVAAGELDQVGMPGGAAYGATKAALDSMTRSWAAEYSPAGVRINTVASGPVYTAIQSDEVTDAVGATTIMARAAQPDEIANVIVFLASPKASYITGAVISADGGRAAI